MEEILEALDTRGPMTGKELLRAIPLDDFRLWAACCRSDKVYSRIVGRRYLRLDSRVQGYARFSPSIMREFRCYTVLGTLAQAPQVECRANELEREVARISRRKFVLAQKTIEQLVEGLAEGEQIRRAAVFMIAGDVVYGMAHDEPRPESSTGELVRGSDLDIVVVVEGLRDEVVGTLDAAIHQEKYRLLMSPAAREEIDSIIKDTSKVQEQLEFRDFRSMIASKILHEAQFLFGSQDLFNRIKRMVQEGGIPGKIGTLEKKAAADRKAAEDCLLHSPTDLSGSEAMKLFLTAEEKDEIF